MTSGPAISVLLPVHNGGRYLRQALDSVVEQTFRDWELIVVLDRCTDDSYEISLEYQKLYRVKIMCTSAVHGLAAALNVGLSACDAPLVARLDADDICINSRLERQHALFQSDSDLGLLGTSAILINASGEVVGQRVVRGTPREMERSLLWRNQFIHSSVMFRADAVISIGGYDIERRKTQDYDLWLRLLGRTQLRNIPEPLIYYRIHPGQDTVGPILLSGGIRGLNTTRHNASVRLGLNLASGVVRSVAWIVAQGLGDIYRLVSPHSYSVYAAAAAKLRVTGVGRPRC